MFSLSFGYIFVEANDILLPICKYKTKTQTLLGFDLFL